MEIKDFIAQLKQEAQVANRLEVKLEQKMIAKSDDENIVTAVDTGRGNLVALRIDESVLSRQVRLGAMITMAVRRARAVSDGLREAAREKYLPGVPSAKSENEAFSAPLDPSDFSMVEIDGSWDIHNRIAENIEAFNKLVEARKNFSRLRVRQEIGSGSGFVAMNVDESDIGIDIEVSAPRQVGVERLARQVLEAVHAVEKRASVVRRQYLDEIAMNGMSLRERMQRAERLNANFDK